MIIGVDRGTTYTKTSENVIFKSTVSATDDLIQGIKVKFEGKDYTIGNGGRFQTDLMKSTNDNTKLLVCTALGMSSKDTNIIADMIIGLPIGLYSRQKLNMKYLFDDQESNIQIDGISKHIYIRRCEVFPESAGIYYTQSKRDCLIIDIGGISVDTALFIKDDLVEYSTYSLGIMKLFNAIADEINSNYDTTISEWDIPEIIKDGLYIYGQKINLNLDDLIIKHVTEIRDKISLKYDLKPIKNILICGGGGLLLKDYFKKLIPQCELYGDQFTNAKGFKNIAEVKFK